MPTLPNYDTWEVPFPSSGDFGAHLRVDLDNAGQIQLAGASDPAVGYLTERGAENGYAAAVRIATAPSQVAVASAAITAGSAVFAAANGQVAGTGTVQVGIARTAAGASGDFLLIHPIDGA